MGIAYVPLDSVSRFWLLLSRVWPPAPDTVAANAVPANGTFGNFHRNNVYGPGMVGFNASLGKTFNVYKERCKFELRADATNVMNHPVFANPSG